MSSAFNKPLFFPMQVEVTPENIDEIVKETVSLSLNYSSIDETGIQAIAEILNNSVMVETDSMNASPEVCH